ncbi:hypothetical protein LBMAG57_19470 [Verrucomicrobiota bacterium]|nr:hypothetical protein LBMAG57_19470 [Verrucomicrobiota bacterium]
MSEPAPTPETDAKLAAATEDSSATASPPSDWPAFARAEQDELNRQLSVALKGKRPYSSKFADETIASQVKRITELEEKLNGWFSERNAARDEQDIAFSLGEHAMFCAHHTDAERVANTVGGNCPICNKAQIRQLRAERDALAKERDALLTELDEAAKGNA